ncbi:hypothetical protein WICMUC_002352 [Wickerhamomyces mucosus]|uniref:Uncharacterized protein n=1 Tax=Wickerhamomyces mucosus TaxID=1378264 RepID=A0A9P8TEW6_9ASCO|nr:hypothetical protein WICMUC_002352 [Wickerhamomyces mucosus]
MSYTDTEITSSVSQLVARKDRKRSFHIIKTVLIVALQFGAKPYVIFTDLTENKGLENDPYTLDQRIGDTSAFITKNKICRFPIKIENMKQFQENYYQTRGSRISTSSPYLNVSKLFLFAEVKFSIKEYYGRLDGYMSYVLLHNRKDIDVKEPIYRKYFNLWDNEIRSHSSIIKQIFPIQFWRKYLDDTSTEIEDLHNESYISSTQDPNNIYGVREHQFDRFGNQETRSMIDTRQDGENKIPNNSQNLNSAPPIKNRSIQRANVYDSQFSTPETAPKINTYKRSPDSQPGLYDTGICSESSPEAPSFVKKIKHQQRVKPNNAISINELNRSNELDGTEYLVSGYIVQLGPTSSLMLKTSDKTLSLSPLTITIAEDRENIRDSDLDLLTMTLCNESELMSFFNIKHSEGLFVLSDDLLAKFNSLLLDKDSVFNFRIVRQKLYIGNSQSIDPNFYVLGWAVNGLTLNSLLSLR